MPWLKLDIHTEKDHCQMVEATLEQLGAGSVTLLDAKDQPILEPAPGEQPLWQAVVASGLFNADESVTPELLCDAAATLLPSQCYSQVDVSQLIDKDWERVWLAHFKPMQFADNLWICPSTEAPPNPKACNVILDPGLAFGTGSHPTTAMCLTWLAKQKLKGKTLLDYGCGSGILAIAAMKLGAQSAVGVDNDMQALIATRDNLYRNAMPENSISTYLPEDLPVDLRADILVANILAQPLMHLCTTLASHLQPGASIGLSGILATQVDALIGHYELHGFTMNSPQRTEEWCFVAGTYTGDN